MPRRNLAPPDRSMTRHRVVRALENYAEAMQVMQAERTKADGRAWQLSRDDFLFAMVRYLVGEHSRCKIEKPKPKLSAADMAFQAAELELRHALQTRADDLGGFDDYEAEWISESARKAVAAV